MFTKIQVATLGGFINQNDELAPAYSLPEQRYGLFRKPLTASRRLFGICRYAEM